MITHLISTTEFVRILQQSQLWGNCYDVVCNILEKYVNFISQKPTLDMFVPCDEEGNVLEEPKGFMNYVDYTYLDKSIELQYQQAQSKVLFKGWELSTSSHNKLENSLFYKSWEFSINFSDFKSLEEIVFWIREDKMKLAETALKEIGL